MPHSHSTLDSPSNFSSSQLCVTIGSTPITLSNTFCSAWMLLCPTVAGVTRQTVSNVFSCSSDSRSRIEFTAVSAPGRYVSEVSSVT